MQGNRIELWNVKDYRLRFNGGCLVIRSVRRFPDNSLVVDAILDEINAAISLDIEPTGETWKGCVSFANVYATGTITPEAYAYILHWESEREIDDLYRNADPRYC